MSTQQQFTSGYNTHVRPSLTGLSPKAVLVVGASTAAIGFYAGWRTAVREMSAMLPGDAYATNSSSSIQSLGTRHPALCSCKALL
jgi:hypothetical protein